MLTNIYSIVNHRHFWLIVVSLAVLLRLSGLMFGLPLLLVADEPSAIFGALKMMELKTAIPALHAQEFASVLYYPPYLSYLYLLPFTIVGSLMFLFSGQSLMVFTNLLIVDSSLFFIIARLFSMAASVASIILIYQVARRLFATAPTWVSVLAAFFLAVSPTYLVLGSVARHWAFIGLIVTISLRLLVSDIKRKYFYALLVSGLGMGISTIAGIGVALTLLWLFLAEGQGAIIRAKEVTVGLVIFGFLAWLPNLLYPQSLGFVDDVSLFAGKSFAAAIFSAPQFLLTAGRADIFLIILAAVGILFLIHDRRWFGWLMLIFTLFYSLLFYLAFHLETRFLTALMPLFALAATYAAWRLANLTRFKSFGRGLMIIVILLMLFSVARLTYLISQDDTRALVYDWAQENIPVGSRVIVAGELLRLPITAETFIKLEALGPQVVRRADRAEVELDRAGIDYGPAFQALNLYTFEPAVDQLTVKNWLQTEKPDYVIIDDNSPWWPMLAPVLAEGEVLQVFAGSGEVWSYTASHLWGFPWTLWRFNHFGPDLKIIRLP